MAFFIGCGVILQQGEKYVLIQEVRHEKAGFYNLTAGTLELHEDVLQCVIREAKEETGADVTLDCFVGVYQTVIASGSNVVFLVFAGSVADDTNFRSDEHKIIKSYSYEELLELNRTAQMRSPIVLKSIQDYRDGQQLPLESVQTWHVDHLPSITVEKDH